MFSLFNGVITGFATYEAIRYRRIEMGKDYNYTHGFTAGLTTGFIASILFTVFMAIYPTEINPNFIAELVEDFANHYDVGVATFAFIVFIDGLYYKCCFNFSFYAIV